jgi:hypothetical protein
MANEHLYTLKVRPAFKTLIAQKQSQLSLEDLVPSQESVKFQSANFRRLSFTRMSSCQPNAFVDNISEAATDGGKGF